MEECYRCVFSDKCKKTGCADRGHITICIVKYLNLLKMKQVTCKNKTNEYLDVEFVCSNCGFRSDALEKLEIDEENGDMWHCHFDFNYCPCCGAKVIYE